MALTIKQGDAYKLPIKVNLNGAAVDINAVEKVEFVLGGITKLYPNEVEYVNGEFLYPLTQENSFSFEEGSVDLDIRVKFVGGNVQGIPNKIVVTVNDAESEAIL